LPVKQLYSEDAQYAIIFPNLIEQRNCPDLEECKSPSQEWQMKGEVLGKELKIAIDVSEEIRSKGFATTNIQSEIAELELSYGSKPSRDAQAQLLVRYVLLSQWLPVRDSGIAIKIRKRFQQHFPDHFRLKTSASSIR